MAMTSISIAMTTFNGEKYLTQQLESIARQTIQPNEMVVCDDCSSDNTVNLVREFSKTVAFKVIVKSNRRNLGYTKNFDQALSLTTGDLVFLSDQDDYWHPEKIQQVLACAETHPSMLAFLHDAELTDDKLTPNGLTVFGQYCAAGGRSDTFKLGCCAVLRRRLIDICAPIPEKIIGHEEWYIGIAEVLNKKNFYPQSLQYYRRHLSNTTNTSVNHPKEFTELSLFRYRASTYLKIFGNRSAYINNNWSELVLNLPIIEHKLVSSEIEVVRAYMAANKNRFEFANRREYIRRRPFVSRVIIVLWNYILGRYRDASGLKSVMIDLLGPF